MYDFLANELAETNQVRKVSQPRVASYDPEHGWQLNALWLDAANYEADVRYNSTVKGWAII